MLDLMRELGQGHPGQADATGAINHALKSPCALRQASGRIRIAAWCSAPGRPGCAPSLKRQRICIPRMGRVPRASIYLICSIPALMRAGFLRRVRAELRLTP